MHCDLLTVFPELIQAVGSQSMMKRAQEKGLLTIRTHNLRDYTDDPHRSTDDTPYGGGGGMVMKAEPIFLAIDAIQQAWARSAFFFPRPKVFAFRTDWP